jgi:amino acid transporter
VVSLSVASYVFLVGFCIFSAGGIEYRRQRWLDSRSPWDLCRMILAAITLLAVILVMPSEGAQRALYPFCIGQLLSLCIGVLEDHRTARQRR